VKDNGRTEERKQTGKKSQRKEEAWNDRTKELKREIGRPGKE
jgi:hypothetical protein